VINYVASDWERDIDHDAIDMRGLRRIRAHRGMKVESYTKLDSSFILARSFVEARRIRGVARVAAANECFREPHLR